MKFQNAPQLSYSIGESNYGALKTRTGTYFSTSIVTQRDREEEEPDIEIEAASGTEQKTCERDDRHRGKVGLDTVKSTEGRSKVVSCSFLTLSIAMSTTDM
jgi:hypothetical protein